MLNAHTHCKWLGLELHAAVVKHSINIVCRVARRDDYRCTWNLLVAHLDAYGTILLDCYACYARVEVNLTAALDNLSTHIGNNSRQSVGTDMRVRLVEYCLRSAVIYKTLQRSVVVASLIG